LLKRVLVYVLEAVAARCSDAELVQNPEDLAVVRRLRIAPRAELLGNGVDLRRFDPAAVPEARSAALRAELGIGDHQIVVGTVGRLVREKGYAELFEMAGDLGPDGFVLVCVGGDDPAKADALDDATVEAARARGIRILGHRDDIEVVLRAFDVFVLASHREGYPRAAMEAAAMGLPIVATDIRGCREVVTTGVNGILVPPRDADAIAAAVRRLADPELRAQFGRASRARALRDFDERAIVARVLATYRDVARRKGRALALREPDASGVVTDPPSA
jgi:glycosyltransferase involved in cell wall biosynthesis